MAIEVAQMQGMRNGYQLDASFVCEKCFGPLEVAYDLSGLDPEEAKRKIQAGSQRHLALCRLPALRRAAPATRSSRG